MIISKLLHIYVCIHILMYAFKYMYTHYICVCVCYIKCLLNVYNILYIVLAVGVTEINKTSSHILGKGNRFIIIFKKMQWGNWNHKHPLIKSLITFHSDSRQDFLIIPKTSLLNILQQYILVTNPEDIGTFDSRIPYLVPFLKPNNVTFT